jgi:predicted regulator of amino acid metabolism with ACT domain
MLQKSTEVNRIIAKSKFKGLEKNTNIDRIFWSNKISPNTFNINKSTDVVEVEIIKVKFNKEFEPKVLTVIDQAIPNHKIFYLSYFENGQSKNAYATIIDKKLISVETASGVELKLQGNSTTEIYQNFLRQIINQSIGELQNNENDIASELESHFDQEEIKKQIAALTKKIALEKQLNKKQQLAREKHRLENKLR